MNGTVIEVKTSSPARLLTALSREGVGTGSIIPLKGGVRFTVEESNSAKTFAFLEKLCYTYRVVERSGGRARLTQVLSRAGLAAGAAVVIALHALFGGNVWRIEIDGNERLSDKAVLEMLAQSGVRKGVKGDFDFSALESAMRSFDDISECSVSMRGSTLKVSVIERSLIGEPVADGRADIVSRYDARVTRVVCERGTPLVGTGDVIAAGSTLIEGASYTTLGDDYGNPVLMEEFRASGEVYGAVVFSASAAIPAERTVYERTGRKKTRTVIKLFGLSIGRDADPYALSEKSVTGEKLALIPIECKRITYYETEGVTVVTDPDAEAADITARLADEAAFAGGTVISSAYNCTEGNGLYYLNCYVTAEMLIGELKQRA